MLTHTGGQVQVVQTGDKYILEEKFKQFKPILPKPAPETVLVQPPKINEISWERCHLCQKQFVKPNGLKNHMKLVHEQTPVVVKKHVVFPSANAAVTTKQSTGSGNTSQDEDFMSNVIIKTEIMDPEEEEEEVLNDAEFNNDASADNNEEKHVVKFGVSSQEDKWHQCEQCKNISKIT